MIFAKNFARNYENKNNTWNIRHLVNKSFIPVNQPTSTLYCRLSDFKMLLCSEGNVDGSLLPRAWQSRVKG